jgi:hypothetical protein
LFWCILVLIPRPHNVIGTVMNDSNHGAFPLLWYVNQVHFRIFFCEQLISFFVVKYSFELGDFFENRYYHQRNFDSDNTWRRPSFLGQSFWWKTLIVTTGLYLIARLTASEICVHCKFIIENGKMAPVNISQNDYLVLSLCLLCITILRRRIRHRTRVGKRRTRY